VNCQHCKEPNPERFFNCRSCGQRAAKPKWQTSFVVRENTPWAKAIRTDQISFGTKDMDTHVKETKKKNDLQANKDLHSKVKWKDDV